MIEREKENWRGWKDMGKGGDMGGGGWSGDMGVLLDNKREEAVMGEKEEEKGHGWRGTGKWGGYVVMDEAEVSWWVTSERDKMGDRAKGESERNGWQERP